MSATPQIAANGLQLLQHFLGIEPLGEAQVSATIKDIVFVAVDFEGLDNVGRHGPRELETQVGFAIFDLRDPCKGISTHHFVTGGDMYCADIYRKFRFGDSCRIKQKDMFCFIRSVIPLSRDIVLVGHNMRRDLECLEKLNFDCEKFTAILDTGDIAMKLWARRDSISLRDLLKRLSRRFENLHCAGNDAHFILQALLILAWINGPVALRVPNYDKLREIAFAPVPRRTATQQEAIASLVKSIQRQAKSTQQQQQGGKKQQQSKKTRYMQRKEKKRAEKERAELERKQKREAEELDRKKKQEQFKRQNPELERERQRKNEAFLQSLIEYEEKERAEIIARKPTPTQSETKLPPFRGEDSEIKLSLFRVEGRAYQSALVQTWVVLASLFTFFYLFNQLLHVVNIMYDERDTLATILRAFVRLVARSMNEAAAYRDPVRYCELRCIAFSS